MLHDEVHFPYHSLIGVDLDVTIFVYNVLLYATSSRHVCNRNRVGDIRRTNIFTTVAHNA